MIRWRWAETAFRIRIVRRPAGEAPEWVRDAWIGIEIPLLVAEPVSTSGFGVLTGPKNIVLDWFLCLAGRAKPVAGYVVAADTAVACLAEHAPAAADWWRTEVPYLVRPGARFVFDEPSSERIG
ncbi:MULTISPECIES: hypothetical protein [unclassified Brevundimonas]|uniref:hypothetical protein n=1 Tax=unclassified Brevundimonas TaxID=2622653 RepID=UPI0006FA3976|nr:MULTISPECIES: hypothetical protein [unclassified Brevundimonas]KQY62310.1 hypothetical protein ASD25_15630 [Brevundimonas sp. Root1423]KRA21708.1 hypothetical protein ASD59_11150 [Brevundimonas sp. Root608]